ncbi:Sporulation related domain-containing protein [Mariprofundus aestuarium]|uniref:Sporulation related domain-containing protein n=1 Tax=Mariprofundus aestuarium TaxID=1921086 RepID=A0A2K8KWP4_MARES|nr:SPOR domain-containing protein [Mariprofundus aestuarium]ATX79330.1 Sporulation related domain-containing protein [Mariprofundus aestuarium]
MSDKTDKGLESSPDNLSADDTFTWSTPYASETSLQGVAIDFDDTEESASENPHDTADDSDISPQPPLDLGTPAHNEPEPEFEKVTASEPEAEVPGKGGSSTLATVLSIAAILLSSAAILLNFSDSGSSTWKQEKVALEMQAELNEQRHLELKQQLERRITALEARQEFLGDSLQMQASRIDSKFGMATAPVTADTPVEKPETSAPVAASEPTGWAVNLMSMDDKEAATQEKTRLNALGVPAEISPFYIDKTLKYRIRISGFSDQAAAETYKEKLDSQYGIKDAWVYKP